MVHSGKVEAMTVKKVAWIHGDGSKNHDVLVSYEDGQDNVTISCAREANAEALIDSILANGMDVTRGEDVERSY